MNSETGRTLTFRIGGLEKMRVHSNGHIGINQTSPAEALDVGGNILASGNVVATNIKNYYQTVNNANSTVADSSDSTTQVTNAGCPSTASVWTRYTSWKTLIKCVPAWPAAAPMMRTSSLCATCATRRSITICIAPALSPPPTTATGFVSTVVYKCLPF